MGTQGDVTGKGGLEVMPTPLIGPHLPCGKLSPLASQSVLPADSCAMSLNVFIAHDNLKCFQNHLFCLACVN